KMVDDENASVSGSKYGRKAASHAVSHDHQLPDANSGAALYSYLLSSYPVAEGFAASLAVPVCRKYLLGHVSHGADANQRSETANSKARRLNTGTCWGAKKCMECEASRGCKGLAYLI